MINVTQKCAKALHGRAFINYFLGNKFLACADATRAKKLGYEKPFPESALDINALISDVCDYS